MLYKELFFIKKDLKKYLLAFGILGAAICYFTYKKLDHSILLFFSLSIPGIIIALQTTQSSIMNEKSNGMFEKILTVHKLHNVLLLKAFMSFIMSIIGLVICSGTVAAIIKFNDNLVIGKDVFFCELMIAICINFALSMLLVILYTCINQIIVINGFVLIITMAMSVICYGIIKADSIYIYTLSYCVSIIAIGLLLAIGLRFIKYSAVIK